MLWSKEFVVSSCIHPRFKTKWLPEDKRQVAFEWVLQELRAEEEDYTGSVPPSPIDLRADTVNKKRFFLFENCLQETEEKKSLEFRLDAYFKNDCTDVLSITEWNLLKRVFLKYNTNLPSSVPVERMFSIAGEVFKSKRLRILDKNFEKQLLLKLNKEYAS